MPRIGKQVLDCTFYLYEERSDAEQGLRGGGTGFLLGVPRGWPEPLEPTSLEDRTTLVLGRGDIPGHLGRLPPDLLPGEHLYAVTNRHLVDAGITFARFNLKAGGTSVIELKQEEWVKHPNLDDVAVCPLLFSQEDLRLQWVGFEQLLSERLKDELGIGPGDECITIGRFVGHDGRERSNRPAARFGFLSMMPDPEDGLLTRQPGGTELRLEGYVVEGRSQGGFSGSPVFLFMPPWQLAQEPEGYSIRRKLWEMTGECFWLLGVNWSHFPDVLEGAVLDEEGQDNGDTIRVELNSGMMCVAPAWKILEVLNQPRLEARRREECGRVRQERHPSDG